ncbi:MAG: lytic transglycosylase domain-containing protein [bacterium]|nr:lytic transglycosylase domain-containing protein [bacterium]
MKVFLKQRKINITLVLAGCLLSMLITLPVHAQGSVTQTVIDGRSPLSIDIKDLLLEQNPSFTLNNLENINHNVQAAASDYSLQPSTILALMKGEESYAGYPQTRLYYYNLDNNVTASQDNFPSAWFDAERVARSYYVQYERYGVRDSAIAAYFVGSQSIPTDGDISSLPQAMIDLITSIMTMDAEWSHLGEQRGPQVVEVDESTPETSFEQTEYDFSEVEQAYIQNMMHFNPGLDDETASEIFAAIYNHASDFQAVDARLVMALVACESSFRPNAESNCGAQGLGQLMPFTSERFGVEDPFDIDENIRATFAYLDREINRWNSFNYPLDRILAAYNAGPGAVEEYSDAPYNGIPPYEETVNYVKKVVNIYFYLLPEEERGARLSGQSRHVIETNGSVQLAR